MKTFLKNIFDYLNGRFSDRWLHFWAGFIIAVIWILIELAVVKWQGFAASLFLIPAFSLPFGAMIVVALIGGWKEIIVDDKWGLGTPSRYDFWNTVKGGLAGAVGFWIIILIFHLVPSDGRIITKEREWKEKIERIHKNDPASFDDNSSTLKQRSDSLIKIMFEKQTK